MAALAPKLLPGGAIRVRVRPSGRAARRVVAMVMAARVRMVVRYATLAVVDCRHTVPVMPAVVALVVHSAAALPLFGAFMPFVLVVLVMRPAAVLAFLGLAAVGVVAVMLGRATVLAVASESRLDPADFANRLDLFSFLLNFRVTAGVFHFRLMQPAAAPSVVRLKVLTMVLVVLAMVLVVLAMVLTSLHVRALLRTALSRTFL
jgi:hypothetical protein